MKSDYGYRFFIKFLVVFFILVYPKTIASYDEFEGYGEDKMDLSSRYERISPSEPTCEPPMGDSDDERVFDVSEFGANAYANLNSTPAFVATWEAACQHPGKTRFFVPEGKFLVGAIEFNGPCRTKSTLEVEIRGNLLAPVGTKEFRYLHWITFSNVNDIVLFGRTNLDGQGQVEAWKQESCQKASKCDKIITSLTLVNVSNAIIRDITISNAKGFHLGLHSSHNVTVHNVSITSPWDSPNTDGIHVGSSSSINIINSIIGVGDDCVSLSPSCFDVLVSGTRCGPGHGISIGSLGKSKNEEVRGIKVKNCTIIGSKNGVRIKTWPTSPPGEASNITFEDILMINVSNPIIIDQEYCPSHSCNTTFPSMVKLSNIKFKNVRGTYNTEFGVTLRCSSAATCENIIISDVHLTGTQTRQKTGINVKGSLHGLAVFNSTFT